MCIRDRGSTSRPCREDPAPMNHRPELVAGHFSGWSKWARGPKSNPRGPRSQRAQGAKRPSPRLRTGAKVGDPLPQ
eukprot:431444-Alexandrium_andersonii.AAC.1